MFLIILYIHCNVNLLIYLCIKKDVRRRWHPGSDDRSENSEVALTVTMSRVQLFCPSQKEVSVTVTTLWHFSPQKCLTHLKKFSLHIFDIAI